VNKLLSEADLRDQKGKLIEMSDLMAGEAKVPNVPM